MSYKKFDVSANGSVITLNQARVLEIALNTDGSNDATLKITDLSGNDLTPTLHVAGVSYDGSWTAPTKDHNGDGLKIVITGTGAKGWVWYE